MKHWIKLTAAVALCTFAATWPVRAQIASNPPPPGSMPGWSFAVTPYVWLPRLSANLEANNPRGGTVSTTIDAGIGAYISDLNFATMVGGVARYDRFSVVTDLIYFNASLTSNENRFSSVNLVPGPIDIPRSLQLDTGTRLDTTIWSLAGGYTLLQGGWGNLDVVGGLRMLAVGSTSNLQFSANIFAPDRTIALSRTDTLNINKTYFNAIGGVTGRIKIPDSRFYLPFYLDAGGGALPLTWEAYGGIAYTAANWADVSVGYRYLAFESGRSTGVHNLSFGGVIIAANFRF
jgi:hypothetical protein